jgi:hypothetical protein
MITCNHFTTELITRASEIVSEYRSTRTIKDNKWNSVCLHCNKTGN